MHRRELLRLLGSGALLPFFPPSLERAIELGRATHRAAQQHDLEALSAAQAKLVTTLADLIIPRTDTPGASDVGVTPFIDLLLARWYPDDERDAFLAGLAAIDTLAGGSFVAIAPERQAEILTRIDGEKGERGTAQAEFGRLKSLTLYGYFTSERVVKEVTREPLIPGRFDGCVKT